MNEDTTFLQRCGDGAKRHAASMTLAAVISGTVGTVAPMLEQWHSDKMTAQEIASEENHLQKQIDQERSDRKDDVKALWAASNRRK